MSKHLSSWKIIEHKLITTTTTTTTTTSTTTTTTTTKEIYFCLSLITYHFFKNITTCVKKMDITNSASADQV